MEVVPLSSLPVSSGQHLLEIDIEGEVITLLADPAGTPSDAGVPLHVRPVTRPQMASLLALIERLDVPSSSMPPDAEPRISFAAGPPSEGEDRTVVQSASERPDFAMFGILRSDPPPPSSGDSLPLQIPRASSVRPRTRSVMPPPELLPSEPVIPVDELLGRVIASKYHLESAIGSGMSATVFRAMHLDLRRPLAVKILHRQKLDDNQFVRRFKGEALAASKLEHPNVTRVIDFGQEPDGLLYLVMELLTGRSLEAILAANGPLPPIVAVMYAVQACGALAFAHDEGIIHRDVKPENIMIVPTRDDDGNPADLAKVCDFGLAKLNDPEGDQEDLTTSGMLCGSPAYMSPEQTRGEVLDGRSDLYSLGVTLFECLTGQFPLEAMSLPELFVKKLTHPARKVSSLVPDIDPLLDDIVTRALSTDPRSRHANARVLREELRVVLATLEEDNPTQDRTIVAD